MKRKHIIIISLLILAAWAFGYFNQYTRPAEIQIKEIEKLQTIIDSIYVDKIVEKEVFVPKYITKIQRDTIEVEILKEVIVEKPVEVIKTVYVDKPY